MTRSLRALAVVAALGTPLVLAGPAMADTTDSPAVMATIAPSPTTSGVVMGTETSTSTATPSATTSNSESQVSDTPSGGADTGSGATQEQQTGTNSLAVGGLLLATAAGATVWASRRRTQN